MLAARGKRPRPLIVSTGAPDPGTVDNRCDTAEMGEPRLQHIDTDTDGDAGIGSVTAAFEDTNPAHCCEIVNR